MKLLLSLFALALAGCTTPYKYTDARVLENPDEIRKYEPIDAKDFSFEDKDLKIVYEPTIASSGVPFSFINKGKTPIKIHWDETAFINRGGSTERVFHSGVRLLDRSASQPPTIVIPGSRHDDQIIPTNSASFSTSDYGSGGWNYEPLCGKRSLLTHTLEDTECINQPMGYYITYEVDGKKKSATVKFKYVGKETIKNVANQ